MRKDKKLDRTTDGNVCLSVTRKFDDPTTNTFSLHEVCFQKQMFWLGSRINIGLRLNHRKGIAIQLHQGPYKVVSYNEASGTLHIKRKNYIEPINIRNVRPYFGKMK